MKDVKMIKVRAEENALLIWVRNQARTAYISGEELLALERWTNGENNGFSKRLKKLAIISDSDIPDIKKAIVKSNLIKAPLRSFCAPESLHVELTAKCPLNCPQCYKNRSEAELPYELMLDIIRQAGKMKIFQIALGGGEPLLYPRLDEIISEINLGGMASSVTTSGYALTKEYLNRLQNAGLNHIQISLNGSNKEIHSLSRDGFEYGISALNLLIKSDISFGINYVLRKDNIDDFPALMELAKKHNASNINILRYKPSVNEHFSDIDPSGDQLLLFADTIRKTKGIHIKVDSAFSGLLCFLNGRTSFFSGCGAGRRFLAIDAEGYFRPCSHVDMKEKSDNILNLWYQSSHLNMFRTINEKIDEPCKICKNLLGCYGCRAIELGTGHGFYDSDKSCPFVKK